VVKARVVLRIIDITLCVAFNRSLAISTCINFNLAMRSISSLVLLEFSLNPLVIRRFLGKNSVDLTVIGRVENTNLPVEARTCPLKGTLTSIKIDKSVLEVNIVNVLKYMMYGA